MGRAGFNRKTALATLTLTLAAEAPDLDVIGNFKDPVFGFAHHRGLTHSFLGLFLVSALVVGLVYLIWRIRRRQPKDPGPPPRWGLLFGLGYLAGVVHILLDFTNNYGVRPFWPFNEKWYSWDIVFIVEPAILIFLVLGLVLPVFVQSATRKRFPAALALICIAALWGVRDFEHRRAVHFIESRYHDSAPVRVSAYPYWWNVHRWYGVVETRDRFISRMVDSSGVDSPNAHEQIVRTPPETPATLAAKNSYLGRVYLDWAKYPVVEAEQVGSDPEYIVHFVDLRYAYPDFKSRGALSASVVVNDKLQVVQQTFGKRPAPK
ncbi:MAG: inner membrane protein [Acidobacteriaceae bacterium]|jgi:inner membrane protein